jgi:ATP-binding cassette subfamily C protein CydCD
MNLDKRLIGLLKDSRFTLFLAIALGCASGVLTVFQAGALSQVIDRVFLGGQSLAEVTGLLGFLLGIMFCRALLVWGGEISANALALRVKTSLRSRLVRHLLAIGPVSLRRERTGHLVNAAVEGVEALDAYFSQYLPGLALAALVPVTYLLFVFPVDALSGFVLLLTAPLIPVFMLLIGSRSQALTRRRWQSLSRMSAYFLDVLQGLTTLKLLGRSRDQVEGIAEVSDRFRRLTMSVLRVTFLSALVLEMVATLGVAVVAVEIGLRLLYGRLPFQQALFVLLLAPEFYLPLRLLGARFHAGMAGIAAAQHIFEVLAIPRTPIPPSLAPSSPTPSPLVLSPQFPISRSPGNQFPGPIDISFKNVHFSYPDHRLALNGVTFRIPAGQKVALVGPSGGGKSTVAALLLRFVEPSQGEILVDGFSRSADASPTPTGGVRLPTPSEWRSRVAYVPQRPYLFHDTVLANICLSRPEASLEQVIHAAHQAGAHDFIQALTQGYHTPVGERGARLSGGEAQRIALARAFLKDAPLIILDEATANLDPESEALIQQALQRLLEGRTALIIAHRLYTIREADRIIVLDRGEIAESGVHHELLQRRGLYYRLVHAAKSKAFRAASFPPLSPSLDEKVESEVKGESIFMDWEISPGIEDSDFSWDWEKSSRLGVSPFSSDWERILEVRRPSLSQDLGENPGVDGFSLPQRREKGSTVIVSLLRLLFPFKGWVALSVLMSFATVLSGVGLMTASAYIISAAALHPSIAELQIAIVGVRFFGIARGVFRYLERYLSHQTTFRILARLRVWFYRSIEPLAPARLLSYRSGDLLARILSDIESLESFYVRTVAPPLTAILVAGFIYVFLSRFGARLALVWLVFMTFAGVGVPLLIRSLGRNPGRKMVLQRASLNAAIVDCIQGMPDLFACDQEERQAVQIDLLGQEYSRQQRRMGRINGLSTASSSLLANLGMCAVLVLAIPLIRMGEMEGVYLAVVALTALTGFEAAAPLPLAAQYLESNLQSARRLFEVVDVKPQVLDPSTPLPLPARFDLEVKDLSFRYPPPISTSPHSVTDYVLKEVSFNLPQGKRLAIVGPSGAGKSTLVSLLLRFWEFEEGEILLGGRDLRRYAQDDLRSCLAVVSQNAYLFSASVLDNLRMARPTASEAEIIQAAKQARIHDFIRSLPQGYDTWIGEQGLQLSGGERQRLAIARALLKTAAPCRQTESLSSDSTLLILDEATANLDAITEQQVLRSIQTLMEGRTSLVVTHRLVGMDTMDEILVLDRGRVVERGFHAELVKATGLYRRMWDLQRGI